MDVKRDNFFELIEKKPYLKKDVFIRGFLVTTEENKKIEKLPYICGGGWSCEVHAGIKFWTHPLTGIHVYCADNENVFFLLGHAYNPFTMESDEDIILERIAGSYGTDSYIECINELTGVFVFGSIVNGIIHFIVDPSGMQSAHYGVIDEKFYLTSHAQFVADICELDMDTFVKELIRYKWYGRVMGPYLPGDLSPFKEMKRVVPSIMYEYKGYVSHYRFWPLVEQTVANRKSEYDAVIKESADILHNNMKLVSKKWNKPWISLTGGIDSNTTFASANGEYEKFETFSYISAEKEIPDAVAAKKIADHFNVTHHEYQIPDANEELIDFEERRNLFRHNNAYIAELYDNEMRKKLFLRDNLDCDVEVKSWVSETIRAYWYKHYGRKTMPKLSAKLFRNLYKIFIFNRPLAHKVDKIFDQYIREFEYDKIPDCYPAADMHYNEVTWGSWGGLNITEMKYCFDITFIYNNRRFFDLMFRVPLEKRITDQHHLDMKKCLNKELSDMNIRVVNLKETDFRAFALNIIFTINSILPF